MHWRDHLTKLVPGVFSREFMRTQLIIDPLRLYMVPARISRHRWKSATGEGGVLVDRCRLVQYGTAIDPQLLLSCKAWFDSVCAEQMDIMKALRS